MASRIMSIWVLWPCDLGLKNFAQVLQTSQRCILWVWRCGGLHICTILVSTRLNVYDVEISSRMTWRRHNFYLLTCSLFSWKLSPATCTHCTASSWWSYVKWEKSDLTINFTYLRNPIFPSCTKFHIDPGAQTTGGIKLTSRQRKSKS